MAAMASGGLVPAAEVQAVTASLAAPARTIVLRGDDTLTPDPAGFIYDAGESAAFVVTNESDTDRILGIDMGETAGTDGAMAEHDGSVDLAGQRIVIQPGETATIVHQFEDTGVAAVSWTPVDHAEHGFVSTIEVGNR